MPLPSPISPLLPLKNEAVENAGEGMEKWEPSYTIGGNVNGAASMDNSMEVLQKAKSRITI